MKKVFLMAALVLASALGGYSEASASSLMPVKKTTAKKTTTKKKTTTSTKKSTASTKKTTSTAATTTPSTTTTTTNNTSSTGSTVAGVLGGLLGAATGNGSSASGIVNGILNNVIGTGTFKQADLCASTWKYSKPGCAFTSENLLAKAGGEIVANKIENQLSNYYKKVGFSGSNTYIKFNEDGTFESKIDGKSWKGTYTFDEKTHAVHLKGLLLSASGFATKTTSGISLLFESKKLLTLIQTLTALSGNSTLSTIGNISKNYDGVRIGFEMTK